MSIGLFLPSRGARLYIYARWRLSTRNVGHPLSCRVPSSSRFPYPHLVVVLLFPTRGSINRNILRARLASSPASYEILAVVRPVKRKNGKKKGRNGRKSFSGYSHESSRGFTPRLQGVVRRRSARVTCENHRYAIVWIPY